MPVKRAFGNPKAGDLFGQLRNQPKMLRAGLYARVSTKDQQTLPMQNRALREYAARPGWEIALQVREVGSGAVERKAREQLMEAARRREIDLVLAWRLDRRGRSVTDLLATLQALEHLGVGFVSLTEALDLTRAGLANAERNGKRLGRPSTAALHATEIGKLHRAGITKSEIGPAPQNRSHIGTQDSVRTISRRIDSSERCPTAQLPDADKAQAAGNETDREYGD